MRINLTLDLTFGEIIAIYDLQKDCGYPIEIFVENYLKQKIEDHKKLLISDDMESYKAYMKQFGDKK